MTLQFYDFMIDASVREPALMALSSIHSPHSILPAPVFRFGEIPQIEHSSNEPMSSGVCVEHPCVCVGGGGWWLGHFLLPPVSSPHNDHPIPIMISPARRVNYPHHPPLHYINTGLGLISAALKSNLAGMSRNKPRGRLFNTKWGWMAGFGRLVIPVLCRQKWPCLAEAIGSLLVHCHVYH